MMKLEASKVINQEIVRAMQILTNQNPDMVLSLGDIVKKVQSQIKDLRLRNSDQIIKDAIYKISDLGLIDNIGFNQFCCADCFVRIQQDNKPPEPEMANGRRDYKYAKSTTILSNRFEPRSKKTYYSTTTLSSSEGKKMKKTRKTHKKPEMDSEQLAAKRQKLERYLNGGSTSEDDVERVEAQLDITNQRIPVDVWNGYQNSLAKSRSRRI